MHEFVKNVAPVAVATALGLGTILGAAAVASFALQGTALAAAAPRTVSFGYPLILGGHECSVVGADPCSY